MTAVHIIDDPASFRLEARWQQCCQVCGSTGDWQAHHVIPRQRLRKLGLPQYDTRAALRLCLRCHMQFEWGGAGKVMVPVTKWTQTNVCYVFEVLGVSAVQLEGKCGPLDIDPRWTVHLEGGCEHCQR